MPEGADLTQEDSSHVSTEEVRPGVPGAGGAHVPGRLAEPGESRGRSTAGGLLLDVNPETLRNWVDNRNGPSRAAAGAGSAESEEVRALRRREAELHRANEILRTASAFFRSGGARPPTQVIVAPFDTYRGRFGVEPICAVLTEHGLSRSRRPPTTSAPCLSGLAVAALAEAYLANQLRSLWQDNWGVYGARKLWHAARRAGHAHRPRPGGPADEDRRWEVSDLLCKQWLPS